MEITRRHLFGGALLALAGCSKRVPGFDGYVFVANQEGKSLAVVDMAAFATIKHVRFDSSPTAILSHPSRPFIYVLTPENGTVQEIDIRNMNPTRKVQAARSALAMRLGSSGDDAIYVLAAEQRKIVRIPIESFRTEAQYALNGAPTDFDLSEYTNLGAVAYGPEGSVSLIDLKNPQATLSKKVSTEIGTVRFRSDGKALMIADTAQRMLTFLRTPGGEIMSELPLAMRPEQLCFNTDGGQVFVTGEGRDAVAVVYPYKLEVAETVLAGRAPGAMAASADYLFIANPLTGDVSILHIRTRKLVAIAPVGAEPGFVAITPDQQYALVLNRKSGDMAVIRISSIKTDRAKSASLFTMIPVGSRPVSAVVRTI